MRLNPDEVTWSLKQELDKFKEELKLESIGYVLQVGDGIARVYGLDDVMMGELVQFSNATLGMVMNLEEGHVGVVLLGPEEGIKEKEIVKRTGKLVSVPVGPELLGRIVDPLGNPMDGKGEIHTSEMRPLEYVSPNVVQRSPVEEPVETGITAIDAMIPIGRGQRELILGDRQTGKTTLIIDTILNQKDKHLHCIYVAIGQRASSIIQLAALLDERGAMEYTTIIAAPASAPAAMQYIAPYAGAAMGEYYMYGKKHAICFYDDLTKHAQAYRQLSLLLRRPPGREAYPGDIFYQHSRLLERAAKLNDQLGGGSLTAIPVIETLANDITTYIPTNVISITDGQIYLESNLFNTGVRPAINVGNSTSRVGANAQTNAMKKSAKGLRLNLAQYRELAAFAQFGSDLDEKTQALLRRGERMIELLKQDKYSPCSLAKEVIILYAGTRGYLDDIPIHAVKAFDEKLWLYIQKERPDILERIAKTRDLSQEDDKILDGLMGNFKQEFKLTL